MSIKTFDTCVTSNFDYVHEEIDKCLAEGYVILNVTTVPYDGEISERWTLHKPDAVATVDANKLQVRSIKSIERVSTFSKSAKRYFDFWRCILDGGDKVNIFDHPDESRNTFKIVTAQGWGKVFEDTDEGIEYELDAPIPVTVTHDGQWYSIVGIQSVRGYMLANEKIDENAILPHYDHRDSVESDTETESIEAESIEPSPGVAGDSEESDTWYHPSPDDHQSAIDLRNAIDDLRDLDFPPFSGECSMCGKERTLNQHGRCSQCETIWKS